MIHATALIECFAENGDVELVEAKNIAAGRSMVHPTSPSVAMPVVEAFHARSGMTACSTVRGLRVTEDQMVAHDGVWALAQTVGEPSFTFMSWFAAFRLSEGFEAFRADGILCKSVE